ncbi:hypothetical protein [Sessilibacter corallicola]|uniref:Uncharacterized protein n=1 Tax=Sessilibacter corallicola TaxID=2904075 RepID=A0ABQ0A7D7_9GAMM
MKNDEVKNKEEAITRLKLYKNKIKEESTVLSSKIISQENLKNVKTNTIIF